MREWIYGEGMGNPLGNEDLYMDRYLRHYNEVRAYFKDRPNDLLEVSWTDGDGWEKICPFWLIFVSSVSIYKNRFCLVIAIKNK